jgi:CMP-N-acetylneuraminic acid synthetase
MFMINVNKCLSIFDEVYVSSDSDWVLELAEKAGARPIKRGEELCGDVPDIPVFQHAMSHMGAVEGIVAVHANNPTIEHNLIATVKKIMELGVPEVMTCFPVEDAEKYKDQAAKIYGSIRGISKERLENYGDPYEPDPDVMIVDTSIEIETEEDYKEALKQ